MTEHDETCINGAIECTSQSATIPDGWVAIQRCDDCRTFSGANADEEAAAQYARDNHCRYWAMFPGAIGDDGLRTPDEWAVCIIPDWAMTWPRKEWRVA